MLRLACFISEFPVLVLIISYRFSLLEAGAFVVIYFVLRVLRFFEGFLVLVYTTQVNSTFRAH